MGTHKFTGLGDPGAAQDAATQNYVLGRKVTDLTAPSSDFSMNSHKITNVTDPGSAQDAATKAYVDSRGKIAQVIEGVVATAVPCTTQIPADNTKPQSGEGDEVVTATITPQNAGSTLQIEACGYASISVTGVDAICAIFKDSGTDAIGANIIRPVPVAGGFFEFKCSATVTAGSTSAQTYKLRMGPDGAATINANADGSSNTYFGSTMRTYIRVTEILP